MKDLSIDDAAAPDERIRHIKGRIRDLDAHEMFPANLWVEEFGEIARPMAEHFIAHQSPKDKNSFTVPVSDVDPIDRNRLTEYWAQGCLAPGAFDMRRRLAFMDAAGVGETLLFGTGLGVIGHQIAVGGMGRFEHNFGKASFDGIAAGRAMMKAHNDWCIRTAALSPRLRPVAALLTESFEDSMRQAQELIDAGIRTIAVGAGQTFAGRSPSHPDFDPFWRLLADNDIAAVLHVGTHNGFLREQDEWAENPIFASNKGLPSELTVDPFNLATCSLAPQNYITGLVLGGLFERVPHLRFGVAEFGAFWIGPIIDNMDLWHKWFIRRLKDVLPMKPSEYVRRNIRVTPFTFEPVDEFIQKYPVLEDVLCFSSDYPHHEGGTNPIIDLYDRLIPLGENVVEKFFVKNAELIMPK